MTGSKWELKTRLEWVIALSSIFGGIYASIVLPFFPTLGSPNSALIAALGPVTLPAYGVIYLLGGLILLLGLLFDKKNVRKGGLATIGLVRAYSVFLSIIVNGLLPFAWLANATVVAIIVLLWIDYGGDNDGY